MASLSSRDYQHNLYNVPDLPLWLGDGVVGESEVLHGLLYEDGDVVILLEVHLPAHGSPLQTIVVVETRQ